MTIWSPMPSNSLMWPIGTKSSLALKMQVEAYLVKSTAFSIDNLLDHLSYADSKNCALLKEAAVDFILENMCKVIEKISFDDAPVTLVFDGLAALERKENKRGLSAMRVDDLCWHAHQHGLDGDDSRIMLISALKEVLMTHAECVSVLN